MRKINILDFPNYNIRNIKLYYTLIFFHNTWFIMGSWFFFWLKFMSLYELGIFDAIAFGAAMIFEIPSGAVSDLLGRRRTLIFAFTLSAVGAATMAFGVDKWAMLFGNIAFISGFSFMSGSDEALIYDSMIEEKKEEYYDLVASKASMIAMFSTFLAGAIGGVLYSVNERYPWYAITVTTVITIFVSYFFIEPKIDTEKFSLSNYIKQLVLGFRELLTPELRKFFLLFSTLSGVFYMYDAGFIRPIIAASFGFDGVAQSYLTSLLTLIAAFAMVALPFFRKNISDAKGLLIITALFSLCFFVSTLNLSVVPAFLLLCTFSVIGNISTPWISVVINKRIESRYRSTTLSTLAFFTKLPYVILAITAGSLAQSGKLQTFNIGVSLIIAIVVVTSLFWLKKDREL